MAINSDPFAIKLYKSATSVKCCGTTEGATVLLNSEIEEGCMSEIKFSYKESKALP